MCCFLYAAGHWTNGADFFWNEYILNYIIATYSKPQVIHLFVEYYCMTILQSLW